MVKMHDVVKIQIHPKYLPIYDRAPKDGIYYGIVFDIDDEHITIKDFKSDSEGCMHFGVLDRFMLDTVTITEYNKDTYRFDI